MLNVQHKITIGSAVWSSTEHSRLFQLETNAGIAIPVNTARVIMAPPKGVSAAVGDDLKIELGYNDQLERVFTGQIESVNWSIDQILIEGAGSARNLLASRSNLFLEKPKASDIVNDLCKQASVKTGLVETGLSFDFYTVGDQACAYDHLSRLASKCGFDLYTDTDDKLVFAAYRGSKSHDLQMGVNIIELKINDPENQLGKVQVYGESPSSLGQGTEAASWLAKKEVKGEAGGPGNFDLRIVDPSIRTQDTAAQAANNLLKHKSPKKSGGLTALGKADIKLGDSVQVAKMLHDAQNGRYKVTQVVHRLSRRTGFITKLQIEAE